MVRVIQEGKFANRFIMSRELHSYSLSKFAEKVYNQGSKKIAVFAVIIEADWKPSPSTMARQQSIVSGNTKAVRSWLNHGEFMTIQWRKKHQLNWESISEITADVSSMKLLSFSHFFHRHFKFICSWTGRPHRTFLFPSRIPCRMNYFDQINSSRLALAAPSRPWNHFTRHRLRCQSADHSSDSTQTCLRVGRLTSSFNQSTPLQHVTGLTLWTRETRAWGEWVMRAAKGRPYSHRKLP